MSVLGCNVLASHQKGRWRSTFH